MQQQAKPPLLSALPQLKSQCFMPIVSMHASQLWHKTYIVHPHQVYNLFHQNN